MSPIQLSNPFRRDPEAPTLKERAAALSAGIARVGRKPAAPAPEPAPEPSHAEQVEDASAEGRVLAASGIDHYDGTMSYCDAVGTIVRRPVARWVDFNAAQMHSKVRSEIARQRVAAYALPNEEYEAWEARVRRELRIDALQVLAFRPDKVFEAQEARRQGIEPPQQAGPRPDLSGLGALASDILDGWRAWSAASDRPDSDPEADAAYERAYDRRGELLDAAEVLPATRDNLLPKALALAWIGYVHLWQRGQERAEYATDGRLALDIHAIACGHPSAIAATVPDPFFDVVAAARAANAAVDAFGRRVAEHKPEGWFQEEQALVAEQARTQDIALATAPTTRAGQVALADYMAELMGRYSMADGSPPDPDSSIWADAYRALSAALRVPVRLDAASRPSARDEAVRLDLSACSVREVCRLYEVFSATADRMSEAMCLPCFSKPLARYPLSGVMEHTPAGDVLDDQQNRMAFLRDACAEEILRRTPADDSERDDALTIRLQHELACEGRIVDRALIAELATAWGA